VGAAAEFIIIRERRVGYVVFRHRAEEMLINHVANGDLPVARPDSRQFRRDLTRQFADLFVGSRRIELFVRVLSGKRPGPFLRPK
jgi:hypothetical protein